MLESLITVSRSRTQRPAPAPSGARAAPIGGTGRVRLVGAMMTDEGPLRRLYDHVRDVQYELVLVYLLAPDAASTRISILVSSRGMCMRHAHAACTDVHAACAMCSGMALRPRGAAQKAAPAASRAASSAVISCAPGASPGTQQGRRPRGRRRARLRRTGPCLPLQRARAAAQAARAWSRRPAARAPLALPSAAAP